MISLCKSRSNFAIKRLITPHAIHPIEDRLEFRRLFPCGAIYATLNSAM